MGDERARRLLEYWGKHERGFGFSGGDFNIREAKQVWRWESKHSWAVLPPMAVAPC